MKVLELHGQTMNSVPCPSSVPTDPCTSLDVLAEVQCHHCRSIIKTSTPVQTNSWPTVETTTTAIQTDDDREPTGVDKDIEPSTCGTKNIGSSEKLTEATSEVDGESVCRRLGDYFWVETGEDNKCCT